MGGEFTPGQKVRHYLINDPNYVVVGVRVS